jgi:hypothetical protein
MLRSAELRTTPAGPSITGAARASAIMIAPASMPNGFVKCMMKDVYSDLMTGLQISALV